MRVPPLRRAPAQIPHPRTVCKHGACAHGGARCSPGPRGIASEGFGDYWGRDCFCFLLFATFIKMGPWLALSFRSSGLSPWTPRSDTACEELSICMQYGVKEHNNFRERICRFKYYGNY